MSDKKCDCEPKKYILRGEQHDYKGGGSVHWQCPTCKSEWVLPFGTWADKDKS